MHNAYAQCIARQPDPGPNLREPRSLRRSWSRSSMPGTPTPQDEVRSLGANGCCLGTSVVHPEGAWQNNEVSYFECFGLIFGYS